MRTKEVRDTDFIFNLFSITALYILSVIQFFTKKIITNTTVLVGVRCSTFYLLQRFLHEALCKVSVYYFITFPNQNTIKFVT